jgi:3-methylfumaryl-CoA hydratase
VTEEIAIDSGSLNEEMLVPGPAEAFAGLVGLPVPDLSPGAALPFLWHWLYLLDRPHRAALGPDGHRARGGIPLPPGPGQRRMFAGGRVHSIGSLRFFEPATRRTFQAAVREKQGRSGPLTFVTVAHEISQGDRIVITEEQDIVYRDSGGGSNPDTSIAPSVPTAAPTKGAPETHTWKVDVDEVLLFRFSALTYNSHRIHYDRDYARGQEGYPGLVVHGPLQALLMAELGGRCGDDRAADETGWSFDYRLPAPLFEGQGLIVSASPGDDGVTLEVGDANGRPTAVGVLKQETP